MTGKAQDHSGDSVRQLLAEISALAAGAAAQAVESTIRRYPAVAGSMGPPFTGSVGWGATPMQIARAVLDCAAPVIAEGARAEERQRFHVPEIAERRDGWGVFCAACSAAVGDYVYPCKVNRGDSWQRIPRMLVPGGQVDKP